MDRRGRRARRIGQPLVLVAGILLCLGWLMPGVAHAVNFSPQLTYPAGNGPTTLRVGDFNGDSDLDLVATNPYSRNVSVLLGGAGYGFAPPANNAISGNPWPIAVSDFNGDSDPDLATGNTQIDVASSLSILQGASGGTFGAAANQALDSTFTPIRGVVAADFNGDSDPDLAFNDSTVRLGTTGSGFVPAAGLPLSGPEGMAVADFNGDSDPDLVLASSPNSQSIAILTGGSGATFTASSMLLQEEAPVSVAVGDFNGDSDPDLAVTIINGSIAILLGGPGATFSGETYLSGVSTSATEVAVGDLNGDSDPDLAVANALDDTVSIYLGGPGATFTGPTDFATHDGPRSVVIGDFDGDSDRDLAVANFGSNDISVLVNTANSASGFGTIVVKKNASPDDSQDFTFTTGGGMSPTTVQLDDDGNTANGLSDTRIFPVAPGSGYSVSEAVPSTWAQIGATCSDGSPVSNISVSVNETVTCTFANQLLGYPRPKNASPLVIRLVPAFEECASPNATHGSPFSVNSCSPPEHSSNFLTVGTPDANGKAANSTGLLTAKVLTEAPIDPNNGDQSDVQFTVSITDVRQKNLPGLDDYEGELRASFQLLRLTDHLNVSQEGNSAAATAVDLSFGFSFSCTATASTDIGSTCSANTTADAVMPGVTPELKRAIWQLGQVQIFDGGGDGDGDTTGDNTVFEVQGMYAP